MRPIKLGKGFKTTKDGKIKAVWVPRDAAHARPNATKQKPVRRQPR